MEEKYLEEYGEGDVLFSEGDPSETMYYLEEGLIGIYKNYGQENQIKVAEITEGFFGEMAIVDQAKRTATAVILRPSFVQPIRKEELTEFLNKNSGYRAGILKALCERIRTLNREYFTACGCISECMKAEEAGKPKNDMLIRQMKKIAESVK